MFPKYFIQYQKTNNNEWKGTLQFDVHILPMFYTPLNSMIIYCKHKFFVTKLTASHISREKVVTFLALP